MIRVAYLLAHLLLAAITGGVGYYITFRTQMRVREFFGLFASICSLWALLSGAVIMTGNRQLMTALWGVCSGTALLAACSLVVFTAAFTGRDWRQSTAVRGVGLASGLLVPVAVTAPVHGQYWGSVDVVETPFTHIDAVPGLLNSIAIVCVVSAILIAYYHFIELSFKSRRQPSMAVFLVSLGLLTSLVPFVVSRATPLLIETYDYTVFGVGISVGVFGYATHELGLANVAPVARDRAIEDIEDPFIVVNEHDALADFNSAAARLFDGIDSDSIGMALSDVAPELATQLALEPEAEPGEFTVETERQQRCFDPRVTPIRGPHGDPRGLQIVLRDITAIAQRQQQLDLLTQVFSRTFRHNVRNKLSVAQGRIERIQGHVTDEAVDEEVERALEAMDRLLSHTEKARSIEQVVDASLEPRTQDLQTLVISVVSGLEDRYPEATISVDVGHGRVSAIEKFAAAVESAVENALEHNPESVTVDITADWGEDTVTLQVVDTGTGIPASEVAAIERENETALSHGSGVGLWLMKWATEQSGGTLHVANTGDGTRVEMTLPRVN